jgi:hypothetical protein
LPSGVVEILGHFARRNASLRSWRHTPPFIMLGVCSRQLSNRYINNN